MKRRTFPRACPTAIAMVLLGAAAAAAQAPPARRWTAPPPPAIRPELPQAHEIDRDGNRIDDRLDAGIGEIRRELATRTSGARRAELAARLEAPLRIELAFTAPVSQDRIDAFEAAGGRIEHVLRAVGYGWTGTLAAGSIEALPAAMGETLLVVAADREVVRHLDEATRNGRVRPVWTSGFAGVEAGLDGSGVTIGIVDDGIDDSHPDLAGRGEYWKDFTTDDAATPGNAGQHGSHVAGIALGSGAAFGVGPATLRYTDSGSNAGLRGGSFWPRMMRLPPGIVSLTATSTWTGSGVTTVNLATRDAGTAGYFDFAAASLSSASPATLATDVATDPAKFYSTALVQNQQKTVQTWGTAVTLSPYPEAGDGFPAFSGVAPGARWAGAKVFTDAEATSSSTTIAAALDDLVAGRVVHGIKVVNMSLGTIGSPGLDPMLRAKANSVVASGIVVVATAGNDGAGTSTANQTDDPGRAALVLTVGASNDVNALTQYTSSGFASPSDSEDRKPDLLAPGGSDYYSWIVSADSNDADAETPSFADRQADDYLAMKGTSMAAPFVAGSAALVIQALETSGTVWTFDGSAQPLLVKMLLCASATETNAPREAASGTNPPLGRAASPKDLFEGYGLVNPDAAVEAVRVGFSEGPDAGATDGGSADRRAWGRRLDITTGPQRTLTLTPDAGADFDLYLVAAAPDAKGNPVVVASSANAGAGVVESLKFVPTPSGTRYLFVKRVSGSGAWSLDVAFSPPVCGDAILQIGETCDDGNLAAGDCCSPACSTEADGSPCSDGLFCTASDVCASGACSGQGDPCAGGAECNDACDEDANHCADPAGTPCTADTNPCTLDACSGAGSCAHPAGNAGTPCRAATGVCDVAESCSGTSATCPADAFAGTATVCRGASDVCDAAERCSGAAASCPADAYAATNVVCRAATASCDVAETCNGTDTACPADALAGAGSLCRASAGVCDVVESCDGGSAACPADAFVAATIVCRAPAGICDGEESCSGSGAACPADSFLPSATVCRTTSGVCDSEERCTGTGASCPADAFAGTVRVCREAAAVCDAVERCSGSSASCPGDAAATTANVCRAAVSTCDVAERCTGTGMECPGDAFATTTVVCRAAAGFCDVVERCTGETAACPADAFAATSVTCRAQAGICDAAESCSGSAATCPPNVFATSDRVCRPSAGICDEVDRCSGNSPACPGDALGEGNIVCRAAAGICDAAETCSGSSVSCPADALRPTSFACRPAAGICDAAEQCSGADISCPADAVAPTSKVCRASGGACDVVERCDGADKLCAADGVAPETTSCPSDGNACTADRCDGSSKSCQHAPVAGSCDDGLFCNGSDSCAAGQCTVHAGNPCSGADGDADCTESCNESSNACSAADPNGSACDDGSECSQDDACTGGVCKGQSSCTTTTVPMTTTTLAPAACGDANGDGRIAATDSLIALRTAVGSAQCTVDLCDFSGDGKVTAADALAILRRAVGQSVEPNCPATAAAAVPSTTTSTTLED